MEAQRTSGNYADSQSWEWGVDRYLNPDLSHLKTHMLPDLLPGRLAVYVCWVAPGRYHGNRCHRQREGATLFTIGRYSISWRTPGFISRPEFGVGQSAVVGALKFQSTGKGAM